MSKAVIINGGNTRKSRLTAIHQQVERSLKHEGIGHYSIYVQELPAVDLLTANFASEEVLGANVLVEEVEADCTYCYWGFVRSSSSH